MRGVSQHQLGARERAKRFDNYVFENTETPEILWTANTKA